jgi:hypothetical protein
VVPIRFEGTRQPTSSPTHHGYSVCRRLSTPLHNSANVSSALCPERNRRQLGGLARKEVLFCYLAKPTEGAK